MFWKRSTPPVADSALAERVDKLERTLRALDEDLSDLHDRFQRFQGRKAKVAALDNPKTDAATPAAEPGFRPRVYGLPYPTNGA